MSVLNERSRAAIVGDRAAMLASALPMDRRLALAAGSSLPEQCAGAIVKADLSGFSSLANRLGYALGPKLGAEELASCVDGIFAAMIEQLHAYGGSIIGFAGDAVTCWFDERRGGASERATAAGLGLERRVAEFGGQAARDGEPLGISARVGVAAGPARRVVVGDPSSRVVDLIIGGTVARAAAAERAAKGGEVFAAPEVVETLAPRLQAVPAVGPFARVIALDGPVPRDSFDSALSSARLSEDALRPWHHPAVLARLLAGDELLTDLRTAAALFVRFGGIDYDSDPEAGTRLDELVRLVQHSLDRYEAMLVDVTSDERGSYACCIVGAPVSHHDNVLRAVDAALDMIDAARKAERAEQLQIGVSYGRVWAGTYGTAIRSCYAARGDAVNLAARLMDHALAAEVLVTREVAESVAASHDTEMIGGVELKGQSTPLDVARLLGRQQRPTAPAGARRVPPLVGRRAELDVVASTLAEAATGASRAVVIRGESGVGKSRLLQAVAAEAEALGFRVVVAAGSAIEQSSPYLGWRAVIGELLGISGHTLTPSDVDRLLEPLGTEGLEQAALLAGVLSFAAPETELTRWMAPTARQENTQRLLARLFEAHRGSAPLLLVLDDLQWLDSASCDLIVRLLRTSERLAVVSAVRPEAPAAQANFDALNATPKARAIDLGPLDVGDALALVTAALDVDDLPAPVARLVAERGGGQPFYSLELAHALRDVGVLELQGRQAQLRPGADLDALEFPETVETVIASRVDRLPVQVQAALKIASVLHQTFTPDLLHEIGGGVAATVADDLIELEARDLLARDAASGGYTFKHVLIRDVVYGRLLYAQKRTLHRRAAQVYERGGTAPAGVLAHHWERAGDAGRAIDALELAGEAALQAGAFRECANFVARAIALTDGRWPADVLDAGSSPFLVPQLRRAGWEWRAAQAHYRLGDLRDSRALAEAAVSAFDRPFPERIALPVAIVLQLLRQLMHRLMPRRLRERAPEGERPRLRRTVRAYFNLAEVYYLASLKPRSAYAALRGLNLAELAGPSLELVEAYGAICIIGSLVGRQRLAERYGRLGAETAVRVGLPYARAINLHQISLQRSAVGRYDSIFEHEAEAARLFRRLADKGRLRDSLVIAGIAAHQAGRLDLAERLLTELLETGDDSDHFLQEIWAATWLGAGALRRGDAVSAIAHLRHAASLEQPADVTAVTRHALLALAFQRAGRAEEAAAEAERATTLIRETGGRPTTHSVLDGYAALAEFALERWDSAQAYQERELWRRRTAEACRNLRTYCRVFPIGEPARRLYAGEFALRLGRRRRALRAWRRTLAAAQRLDMRYEAARTHAAVAATLREGDSRRARHTAAARALLHEMGAAGREDATAAVRLPSESSTPARWEPA
jgi:class 3 adenylate cyclase/tetratricopeptide (TPR) repeat protein